jgi:hypothetical protein
MTTMGKLMIGAAVAVAIALVGFGLVGAAARPRPAPPRVVSMVDSGQALIRDGGVMQTHAQAMLDEAARTSDSDLQAQGERWSQDGKDLVQKGRWLVMDPLAPGNLVTTPADLSRQGAWASLPQTAQAMIHDPSKIGSASPEDLRWNGEAMRAEGHAMADHGRLMTDEVEFMVARHGLSGDDALALRQAASTMQDVGTTLEQNGQGMLDAAERINRSLGLG